MIFHLFTQARVHDVWGLRLTEFRIRPVCDRTFMPALYEMLSDLLSVTHLLSLFPDSGYWFRKTVHLRMTYWLTLGYTELVGGTGGKLKSGVSRDSRYLSPVFHLLSTVTREGLLSLQGSSSHRLVMTPGSDSITTLSFVLPGLSHIYSPLLLISPCFSVPFLPQHCF